MIDAGPIARGLPMSLSIDMNPGEPGTTTLLVTELRGATGWTGVIETTDAVSAPLLRISIAMFPGKKLLLRLNLW